MPVWFRALGGAAATEYLETLTVDKNKMVTCAFQQLPFGGLAETKITFIEDGAGTRVFGTVTAKQLPSVVHTVAKRVFKSFVEKTFKLEREKENQLLV